MSTIPGPGIDPTRGPLCPPCDRGLDSFTRSTERDFRMRLHRTLLLFVLALPTALMAQEQTGRHFQRTSRLPTTPPATATAAAEASTTARVAPLQKLRSGRPWPRHHFGRLPQNSSPVDSKPVDAAARRAPAQKRGFWRAHG